MHRLQAPAISFQPGTVLRHAEIEDILWSFLNPILDVAGLPKKQVRLFLIYDNTINAFATFGPLIVVNSGLLLRCKRAEELVAVLAHEVGHIQGCHLPKNYDAYKDAITSSLLGTGIGALLAVITANPAVFNLGAGLGTHIGMRQMLHFSRVQETEADLLAIQTLHKLAWPVDGAVSLFQMFQDMSGDYGEDAIEYIRTHPLSNKRIALAAKNVRPQDKLPSHMQQNFLKAQAIILAYTLNPKALLQHKHLRESPFYTLAKRTAAYRQGHFQEAIQLATHESLKNPHCPYIKADLAQLYFESGKLQKAEKAIQEAMDKSYTPHALFYLLKARILLAKDPSPKHLKDAENALQKAVQKEPYNPTPWYFLSILEGKRKQYGLSRFYLAEYHVRLGKTDEAEKQLHTAKKLLKEKLRTNKKLALQLADMEKLLAEERRLAQ